jgi:rifampin ADP-ribosylating transferase
MAATAPNDPPLYAHGTRADLRPGDLIEAGRASNYGARRPASWVYFAATLEAAVWGAELARGEGRARVYLVEPTGPIEDDPNLTDARFPGNPTRSYRSREPCASWPRFRAGQATPPRTSSGCAMPSPASRRGVIEAID